MSESHPSHRSKYRWEVKSLSLFGVGNLSKERVLLFQSMWGFLDFSQGIPRIICLHPRLTTIRSRSSEPCGNIMRVWAFQRIVPRWLGVPSTLKALIGWGSLFRGKLARHSSPRSMKFLVAPESTRAVVSTVWVPTSSLIGKRSVHSLGEATSTCVVGEGNIEMASPSKNPEWKQQKSPPWVPRSTSGVLEVFLSHFSLESSGN